MQSAFDLELLLALPLALLALDFTQKRQLVLVKCPRWSCGDVLM